MTDDADATNATTRDERDERRVRRGGSPRGMGTETAAARPRARVSRSRGDAFFASER